jgi:hypothetical protein
MNTTQKIIFTLMPFEKIIEKVGNPDPWHWICSLAPVFIPGILMKHLNFYGVLTPA